MKKPNSWREKKKNKRAELSTRQDDLNRVKKFVLILDGKRQSLEKEINREAWQNDDLASTIKQMETETTNESEKTAQMKSATLRIRKLY